MEKLTYDQIVAGDGYLSRELRNDIPKIKNGVYVNFAYTDYGGDFFDKVCIEFFKERYPKYCICEDTCYYGQNMILWGKVAKEFLKETESYLLGFEDIEQFFSELEYQEKQDFIDNCSYDDLCRELGIDKDNVKESNKVRLYEALYDNTYLDCGVSFYSNIDKAVEDLKLGQPKFKFSWDEFEARQGQKFLGL